MDDKVVFIFSDMQLTVSKLFLCSLFVPKKSFFIIYDWSDRSWYDNAAVSVDKVHTIRRSEMAYKISFSKYLQFASEIRKVAFSHKLAQLEHLMRNFISPNAVPPRLILI